MLEMRNWSEAFVEEYRKEKIDWSRYSEVLAEEREAGLAQGIRKGRAEGFQQGIDHGKAEGFMDGMKAMARKMLTLNRPLQEIVADTGLSEDDVLQLKHC